MAEQPKKRVQFVDLTYIYSAWSETLQLDNRRRRSQNCILPYHGSNKPQDEGAPKELTDSGAILTGPQRPKSANVKKRTSLSLNGEQFVKSANNITSAQRNVHVSSFSKLDGPKLSRPKSAVQFKSSNLNNVTSSKGRTFSLLSIEDDQKLRPKSASQHKSFSAEHDSHPTKESGNCHNFGSQNQALPNGKRFSNSNVAIKRPESAKPPRALPSRPRSSLRRPRSATSQKQVPPTSCHVTTVENNPAFQPIGNKFAKKPNSNGPTIDPCLEDQRNNINHVSKSESYCIYTPEFDITMDTIYSHADKPGVTIWRLMKRKLQLVEETGFGFFHEGDCYLIMWVGVTSCRTTQRTLHSWRGEHTSHRDWVTLEKKAIEVENVIGKMSILTRECEGCESACFLRLFPEGICYLEEKSSPSVAKATVYSKRLYHITNRKYPRAKCISPCLNHLKSDSAYLLDGFPRMYLWLGASTDYDLKTKAFQLTRRIRDMQREGRGRIVVVDETDAKSHNLLLKKLRCGSVHSDCSESKQTAVPHRKLPTVPVIEIENNLQTLYKLTSVQGVKELSEVGRKPLRGELLSSEELSEVGRKPLRGELLSSESVYLLDGGCSTPVTVWVGSNTTDSQSESAIQKAVSFATRKGYPATHPIIRILEGYESSFFIRSFITWRTKPSEHTSLRKTYSAGSVGKRLFARRNNLTVGKTNLTWPDETQTLLEEDTTLQIWRLDGEELRQLSSDQHGIFLNTSCYLLLHEVEGSCRPPILYYWIGARSTEVDKESILEKAWIVDSDLNNRAVLIQVQDGKEPSHFLALINRTMMVYRDQDVLVNGHTSPIQMFSTEEVFDSNIRVTQVPVHTSYLHSKTAVVLVTEPVNYLWYGRECGGYEREYSKMLLAFLQPSRKYNFVVELDGKESPLFWEALEGQINHFKPDKRKENNRYMKSLVLARRNPVLVHYDFTNQRFGEIPDFNQEDLTADAIFILDSFDQIILWVGCEVIRSDKSDFTQITQRYIENDPAGRQYRDVSMWIVKQYHEPDSFLKYFHDWGRSFNIGKERLDSLRRLIRQENANLDANEESDFYSKEFLKKSRVSRFDLDSFPIWKRQQIRRAAKMATSRLNEDN